MTPLQGRTVASLLVLLASCLATAAAAPPDAGAALELRHHHAKHHRARHHCRASARRTRASAHRAARRSRRRCVRRRHAARLLSAAAKKGSGGGSGSGGSGSGKHSTPPANASLPTITGTAAEGQTLTASPGSWTGTQPIGYAFQWRRNGSGIAGATAATYVPTSADVGYQLDVVVVASNGAGSSSATSVRTAAVAAAVAPAESPPPPPPPPPPSAGAAGAVHFVKRADSSFDSEDIQGNAAFMWEHFTRMVGFSPFFDTRTAWAPPTWEYEDAYAIYTGSSLEGEHPEWILRDASGNRLYIPYGNPPTQYAGDISNPAFRRYWIQRAKATLAHGYAGIFVDDVDMWANTGNSKGEKVVPISGVTGQPISDEAWREYLATFMQELREAIPGYEIVHNSVWYKGGGSANRGTTSPVVRRQIQAADVLDLERGAHDSGLTGGTGKWSLFNWFTYIDEVHAMGRAVKIGGGEYEAPAIEYNLAAYFLISTGRDYISDGGAKQNVKSFWQGWSVNLGEAVGPRERSPAGLWSRRFEKGVVYLLEPEAALQTISLPATMHSATLGSVTSVTLSARQGVVLTAP